MKKIYSIALSLTIATSAFAGGNTSKLIEAETEELFSSSTSGQELKNFPEGSAVLLTDSAIDRQCTAAEKEHIKQIAIEIIEEIILNAALQAKLKASAGIDIAKAEELNFDSLEIDSDILAGDELELVKKMVLTGLVVSGGVYAYKKIDRKKLESIFKR